MQVLLDFHGGKVLGTYAFQQQLIMTAVAAVKAPWCITDLVEDHQQFG